MTRINLIPATELSDKHLLAEYRELPRIFSHVEKYGIADDISETYTLGKGHVKFFTNKLRWLMTRYQLLCEELYFREFNINFSANQLYEKYWTLLSNKKQEMFIPTDAEIQINQQRISQKLVEQANHKWTRRAKE